MSEEPGTSHRRRTRKRYSVQLSHHAAGLLEGLANRRSETLNDVISDAIGLLDAVEQGLSEGAELHLINPRTKVSIRLIVTGYSKGLPSWTSDADSTNWEENSGEARDLQSMSPEATALMQQLVSALNSPGNKAAFVAAADATTEEIAANAEKPAPRKRRAKQSVSA